MTRPRITVVIPTRERSDVLAKTLETVVSQDYDELEIIVSDNFSTDNTREKVESLSDSRVRYVNTGRRLSMTHNWEFALSHVKPGWLTVLGDDDGLLPNALNNVSELILSSRLEAIRSRVCSYDWPSPRRGLSFGALSVPLSTGLEVRQSDAWLDRVMKGRASYTDLPMLYNGGFVSTATVDRVRRTTGNFYQSSIPDVYSAVAIASVTQNYLFSRQPFAINGASRHSTGTAYFANIPKGNISPADLFHSEDIIPIHADLPVLENGKFPKSLQAMVFESYLQSGRLRTCHDQKLHSKQLGVVLAANFRNDSGVSDWGRRFSDLHGLAFNQIERSANLRKVQLKLAAVTRNLFDDVSTVHCGSRDLPLRNVYDASIAAASVLHSNAAPAGWIAAVGRRLPKLRELMSFNAERRV